MVFDTYTAAEKFVKTNLNKAYKELGIKDWLPKWFIEDVSDESSLKQDDKIRLLAHGTMMGINKKWLREAETTKSVCFELWYYARVMYQAHEVVAVHSDVGSATDTEIVEVWKKELDGIKEYRREDIEVNSATNIDAYAFALYMIKKDYPNDVSVIPSEIEDEVKAKLK